MEYHVPEHFGLSKKHSVDSLVSYLHLNGFKVELKKMVYYQGIIYAENLNK